ncbi:MAG TPA: arginine--tRNA ligase, partial [bacterium]|nr:arginine--tRNA ligase [bacterium]
GMLYLALIAAFLNFLLTPSALADNLRQCLNNPDQLVPPAETRLKVRVEFVSANPTGPLTIAHGRQAAFGEALARILSACGHEVKREYYLNDEGRQIDLLGESLRVRVLNLLGDARPLPEDGYQGEYLVDLARGLVAERGESLKLETGEFFRDRASSEILQEIRSDLASFGVIFDSYRSQKEITARGEVGETLERLKKAGLVYESEGALFLKTMPYGDDKDRVLVKSDGSYTYLAPDLAYHRLKYAEGDQLMVNLWGPDHFGYITRLQAGLAGLGCDPQKLKIIIVQLTTLYRDGEKVKMSTRQGEFLPLSLLTRELGADVTKFFFLSRKASSHLDFDLEQAKKNSAENPVFYLQYASARIASLFRHQEEKMPGADLSETGDLLERLGEPEERELMLRLGQYGSAVAMAGRNLEPQLLLAYLMNLVKIFHQYYQRCQIIGIDPDLSRARLLLVRGLEKVLKQGLHLLNIRAPERM